MKAKCRPLHRHPLHRASSISAEDIRADRLVQQKQRERRSADEAGTHGDCVHCSASAFDTFDRVFAFYVSAQLESNMRI